jgi:hypothetical protein
MRSDREQFIYITYYGILHSWETTLCFITIYNGNEELGNLDFKKNETNNNSLNVNIYKQSCLAILPIR